MNRAIILPSRLLPLLILVILPIAAGCTISRKQEISIGRQMMPEVEQQFGGLVQDAQLQEYVQRVGESLVDTTSRPDLPWKFRVLQSDQVNAFALPGGFVYITQGLLRRLDNEAQLAAILGHEAAHVVERHSVDQMERAQLLKGGALVTGLVTESSMASQLAGVVGQFAMLSYSREQERDADMRGLGYLANEGYQPDAFIEVMRTLRESGGDQPPQFFSSHPSPENRLDYLQEEIQQRYSNVVSAGRIERGRFRQIVGG